MRGDCRTVTSAPPSTGYRVPGNDGHIMYVWVDALQITSPVCLIQAAKIGHWPASLSSARHCAFHAAHWPAFDVRRIDAAADLLARFLLTRGDVEVGHTDRSFHHGDTTVSTNSVISSAHVGQVATTVTRRSSIASTPIWRMTLKFRAKWPSMTVFAEAAGAVGALPNGQTILAPDAMIAPRANT